MFFRSFKHALFELVGQLFVSSFQQQSHVAHRFLILFRSTQSLDARTKAAFDVILETRPRRLAVDLDVASAQLKCSVDQIDRPSRETCGQEWTKIERAVALNAASDYDFRKRLVDRELQMRIRLIILKLDVVTWFMLFDERRFKN